MFETIIVIDAICAVVKRITGSEKKPITPVQTKPNKERIVVRFAD